MEKLTFILEYVGSLLRQLLNNPPALDKTSQQRETLARDDPLSFFSTESLEHNFFPMSCEQPTILEVPPLPDCNHLKFEGPREPMKWYETYF